VTVTLPLDGLPADPPHGPQWLRGFVAGLPAPQGSKQPRPIYRKGPTGAPEFTGKVAQVESSRAVKPWREDVRAALLDENGQPRVRIVGAVTAELEFLLPRPKRLHGKATPPHVSTPDVDKLVRSTFDAITSAGVWSDDKAVVDVRARKRYAEDHEVPGAHITITSLIAEEPTRA
jgi:crossover junction endodeoxyribonuclease RusA